MRKIISIFVLGILILGVLGAVAYPNAEDEIKKHEEVIFSNLKISEKEEFISVDIEETNSFSMEPGKPILPKYVKVYTFPFGTEIDEVEVSFSESKSVTVSKMVEPAPERQIVSMIHKPKLDNEDLIRSYSEIDTYPDNRYSYNAGAGLDNGERVIFLTISVNPVQYKPSENKIFYSENVEIDVTCNIPTNPVSFLDEYDMLIIAPSEFSSALEPLIEYKNNHDTKTILTTLEEIPDTGVDIQESIKYYVKESIEQWGITNLIIVGAGVENEEIFPVRYAYVPSGSYEENFPSDLYYADVYDENGSFSSWDADGDGKYAEVRGTDMSEVDMYPDVYISRLPCNNIDEVENVVDKIINYEEHNKMLNTIVQIGGDTFPGDGEQINEGEFANAEVLTNLDGYTSTQLWASNKKLTKNNIAKAFRDGVDFADFSGHGSPVSWATHEPQNEDVWVPKKSLISPYSGFLYVDFDLYMINNYYKLPVVVYNACSTSKYSEEADCLSWKTVKKANGGGIASFGASGIGYGSYGSQETERVWGWMEVHLFKEMYENKILGQCWGNCLNDYINSFFSDEWGDTDYKTILEMSLFGDPSLAIEDGVDPKTRTFDIHSIFEEIIVKLVEKFPILERLLQLTR